MNQKFTTLIYTILFVFYGLFISWDAKAAEINNPNMKTAIEAFLKEGGDTGGGYKYNWQRLSVLNPEVEENKNTWWGSFCDHQNEYLTEDNGYLYLNIDYDESDEYILCCGDLTLTGISTLSAIKLNANYLNNIIIEGCSDLNNIDLKIPIDYSEENPKPNINNSIETTVSITNCPAIYSFTGNFASVGSFTLTGSGTDYINELNVSAYNTINNFTLTDYDIVGSVSLYASGFTGDIEVKGCSDFNGFSIETEKKSNTDVNIIFANNSNTSNSFNFFSKNIPLTTLPEIPSSITNLTIECIGHKFSEPLDLSYLISLESLELSGFTQFPDLPTSIQQITCNNGYENGISGEIDLDGLSSLEELTCEGNTITSILNIPSSLKTLKCARNEITTISIYDPSSSLLSYLDCSENGITDFLTQLPVSLEYLYCQQNKISGVLDLSELSSLLELTCDNNNIEEVKIHDNTAGNRSFTVTGNRIPISKLGELTRGFNNLFEDVSYYLPQQLTDKTTIFSGTTVDLSEQLVDDRLSGTWFDITNDLERLRYHQERGLINFTEYLTNENKIEDNNKIEKTEPGVFLFKDEVKGKFLLCEVSETSKKGNDYDRYATHYSLVYVESSASNPEIEFEIKIDDKEYILPNNSKTTILWNSTVELRINPPVIPDGITYDKWEITYFDSSESSTNKTSGKLKNDAAYELEINYDGLNTPTKISVLELKLYNGDANVKTFSYAYTPYRQTFIQDNNPILWFEEKINEEEYTEIENNITTTQEKGNKVFLRMGALIKNANPPLSGRSTPASSSFSWEIEYTTTEGGAPVRSKRINTDQYYYFNEGNPHTEKGTYKYIVNRLLLNDGESSYTFSFTQSPYTNTITITDSDEPGPGSNPGPVLHSVTIPPVDGATTYPGAGTHLVEKGTTMTLLVSLPDDYDQSDVRLVANGDTIFSEESKLRALAYTFLIPVTADTEIEVVGVKKNNSVNTTPQPPEGGAKVWTSPGCIHVSQEAVSNKQHGVRIYTMMGSLVFHSQLSTVNCQLPSGLYLVVVGNETFKVKVE